MYICVCKAVTDRQIRRAAADGACSLRDLTRELGLGTGCGKCVSAAREVLGECLTQQATIPATASGALPLAALAR